MLLKLKRLIAFSPLFYRPLLKFQVVKAFTQFYQGWQVARSTAFDHGYYKSNFPEANRTSQHPIVHYFLEGAARGYNPSAVFNTTEFLIKHPECVEKGINPLYYHIKTTPNARPPEDTESRIAWAIRQGILRPCPLHPRANEEGLLGTPGKTKIVFVGHEASRTGAPLILLRLIEHFAQYEDLECIVFLLEGGDLLDEYQQFAHVITRTNDFLLTADNYREFWRFLDMIAAPGPKVAIANTACVMGTLAYIQSRGIPVVSLVHEYLPFWPKESLRYLYRSCDKLVFPARFMRDVADDYVRLQPGQAEVISQGLLHKRFLTIDKNALREESLKEFGLPENAFVVMGCGTLDIRKGVDRFLAVAIEAFSRANKDSSRSLHFVWLGGSGAITPYQFEQYCEMEMKHAGMEGHVHFLGAHDLPERAFALANVFLLCSRMDPFPCVVHEAMALSTPVITFESCGGAPEALEEGGGYVLPYHNLSRAADLILHLCEHPEEAQAEGRKGRDVVTRKYDFTDYFKRIVTLIESDLQVSLPEIIDRPKLPERAKRPRVIFATRDLAITGVTTLTVSMMRHLIDMGIDAQMLVTWPLEERDKMHIPDVPVRFMAPQKLWTEDFWNRLTAFLKQNAPCVFVPNCEYQASALSPALPDNVGIIGVVHSDDVEHYEHAYRLGRYWNAIVCVSNYTYEQVKEMNPAFAERTRCIPSGIEDVPETVTPRRRAPEAPLRIVYTGRIVEHQKRISDYVQIADALDDRKIPFCLTLVGEGDAMPKLQEALRDYIRDGRVRLPGRLSYSSVRALLDETDVFLLMSAWEGLPISLLEAMAHGCVPVVSQINSGTPDLVTDGENGLVAPIGDIQAFADAIERLYREPDLLPRFGQAAHRRVIDGKFTAKDMAEQYAEAIRKVYDDVANGRYHRPAAVHFLPHVGYIALPPSQQFNGWNFPSGRKYWDLENMRAHSDQYNV